MRDVMACGLRCAAQASAEADYAPAFWGGLGLGFVLSVVFLIAFGGFIEFLTVRARRKREAAAVPDAS